VRRSRRQPAVLDLESRGDGGGQSRLRYNDCMAGYRRALFLLEGLFAVCRLDKKAPIPDWAVSEPFFSVTRTDDELSVVCPQEGIPGGFDCEAGWRCFKIESPFEFDLTEAISSVAAPLAEADIVMFIMATQDSDYLMVKESELERTISVVSQAGYQVHR
jgi:hypothetical protein